MPTLLEEAEELRSHLQTNNLLKEGDTLLSAFLRHVKIPSEALLPEKQLNFKLSADQDKAWTKIQTWLTNNEPYYILRGFSGTGKSFLLQMLANDDRVLFTATTNKAAKVLSKLIGKTAKTIHSQLGLRMVEDEEGLVLKPSDNAPFISKNSILVVDEASMCGQDLFNITMDIVKKRNLKALFVGDPAQLPPVGEKSSKVWSVTKEKTNRSLLKQVMRNEDAVLDLATQIRNCIVDGEYEIDFETKLNANGEGVHVSPSFYQKLLKKIRSDDCDFTENKIIAWRNRTVDTWNMRIREALGYHKVYVKNDLLMLAEPIEKNGQIIAHIDDEFVVEDVHEDFQMVDDFRIDTWRLDILGDGRTMTLFVPKATSKLNILLSEKATYARSLKSKARVEAWRDFWETKRKFHSVRYGYAITAHRSQGSTYTNAWVCASDILANSNKAEAFRCLYVAVSRATTNVYIS